jgi:4-amino-4-deoxy-L-arabinose transferase-like glycosyltransferase
MNERAGSFKTWAGLLLLTAFGLRLGAAFWWEAHIPADKQFAFADSESYWELGERIAHGGAYEFGLGNARIFRTPGYPTVLAALFAVTDNPPVILARALGVVFGTLAVGGVIWLTDRLFTERAALLAGLMATLYPGAVGMSVFVLSEAMFCPLMMAQLVCWCAAMRAENARQAAFFAGVAGLIAGLATLVRPSWLLFTPFAWGIAIIFFWQRGRQVVVGIVMAIGLILAMLPWCVRNYGITGKLTLTTSQFGASLYDGWSPTANGESNMEFVRHFHDEQVRADAMSMIPPSGAFEERLDNRMRDAAIGWAKNNPGRVVQLAGIKFARIWSPLPNAAEFQSWTFRLAILLGYTPLILLAVGGVVRFGCRSWPFALCAMPAVYFTCLHVIFVASIRYRQPPMLALIVLAAGLLDVLWVRRAHDD